jgi:hypothetical protein
MNHMAIVLAAAVLILGTRAVTQAEPPSSAPPGVQKWEYRWELVSALTNPDDDGKLLQRLGAEGWELASTVQQSNVAYLPAKAFFKRPLR